MLRGGLNQDTKKRKKAALVTWKYECVTKM